MNKIPVQIVFKDRDGNLIMNRKSDMSWYDDNEEFVKLSLNRDAQERGVKIISHNYKYSYGRLLAPKAGGTIECVVEYLKRK